MKSFVRGSAVPKPSSARRLRLLPAVLAVVGAVAACAPPPAPPPTGPALSAQWGLQPGEVFYGNAQKVVMPIAFTAKASGSGTAAIVLPNQTYSDRTLGPVTGGPSSPQTTDETAEGYTYAESGTCSSVTVGTLSGRFGAATAFIPVGTRIEVQYTCSVGQTFNVYFVNAARWFGVSNPETWTLSTEVNRGNGFVSLGPVGSYVTTPPVINPQPIPIIQPPAIPVPVSNIVYTDTTPRQIAVEGLTSMSLTNFQIGTINMKLDGARDVTGRVVVGTPEVAKIRQTITVVGCETFGCQTTNAFGQVNLNNVAGAWKYLDGTSVTSPSIVLDLVGGFFAGYFADRRASACGQVGGTFRDDALRGSQFIPPGETTLPIYNCRVSPVSDFSLVSGIQATVLSATLCPSRVYQTYRDGSGGVYFNCGGGSQRNIPWAG